MKTLVQSAGARAAPQSLARLTAQQILDGYRSGRFTPRDVIDEVIAALETHRRALQGDRDRDVRLGAGRSRSRHGGLEER